MLLQELALLNEGKIKSSVVKVALAGDVDDFAHAYSMAQNSAIEMWMSSAKQEALMKLAASGADIRNVLGDPEKNGYKNAKQNLINLGYELFAEEDNGDDTAECILVKKG